MSIIGSVAGKQMRASFDANVKFGQYMITKGATSQSSALVRADIQKFLNENQRGLLEYFQPWDKLNFISGSEAQGYWIEQEKFLDYQANFSKIKRTYLIIAIFLIIMGFLILYYLA